MIKQIEQIDSIKINIQTVGIEMNKYLQLRIQNLIKKIKNVVPEVNWIDVYLKTTNNRLIQLRKVNIRVGIPGQDLIASDVGYTWRHVLKSIEKKLKRQLEKRKAVVLS